MASHTPIIYEAAFEYQGCYARTDIIKYSADTQRWKIYEVKSTTKVKEEQLDDIGLQAWIIANSGLPIEEINLVHLNPACRYPNLDNLFTIEDVTAQLRERYPGIGPRVRQLFSIVKTDQVPSIEIGSHCTSPNECRFKAHCWKEKAVPEFSVLDLPKIGEKGWEYFRQGIVSVDDPRIVELTPLQQRVIDVTKTGERFLDVPEIKKELSTWKFPLVFLDFETTNPAIPRYEATGPYMHVPFQFSVHQMKSGESEINHEEFLHVTATDPRPTLIPALLKACEGEGSIVAYYGRFEADRIRDMARVYPDYAVALEALLSRIVDPLPIIREFIYDKEFKGSFSLKAVAPALLGAEQSYDGMLVSNGGEAQRAYQEIISPNTSPQRKEELIRASLEYCKKDTAVMVDLVKWLLKVVNE